MGVKKTGCWRNNNQYKKSRIWYRITWIHINMMVHSPDDIILSISNCTLIRAALPSCVVPPVILSFLAWLEREKKTGRDSGPRLNIIIFVTVAVFLWCYWLCRVIVIRLKLPIFTVCVEGLFYKHSGDLWNWDSLPVKRSRSVYLYSECDYVRLEEDGNRVSSPRSNNPLYLSIFTLFSVKGLWMFGCCRSDSSLRVKRALELGCLIND
jgi:hypothetical protein